MVKVTSKSETSRRMAKGSINAFLNGKKNKNWAISMIQTSGISKLALKQLFTELHMKNLGNLQLLELEKECFGLKLL
jgi:hypothetical protein